MPLSFPSFSHLERNTNKTKKWRFWAFWVYRQYSKESGRWVGSLNKWFQKFFIYYPGVDDTFLFSYIFVDTPSWQSSECFYLLDVLKSALFQFKFPWWSVRLSFSIFIYLCFPFPLKYIFIYFATWERLVLFYTHLKELFMHPGYLSRMLIMPRLTCFFKSFMFILMRRKWVIYS